MHSMTKFEFGDSPSNPSFLCLSPESSALKSLSAKDSFRAANAALLDYLHVPRIKSGEVMREDRLAPEKRCETFAGAC